jgi:DNA (cytosine-5)-methyltransferase 1
MVMRYVELFAGAGGMSRGLEAAGMTCVAHAEIEPHARAVLRRHWPDVPLHGDVTTVDWIPYQGQVDLVAGGSPCQDLSVAGKRAGLAGSRSNLFYELIRAWNETNATYCLWENVDGARSSNQGADFTAVLSAFVGADVAPPQRWASAGVAAGPTGVAAWRVLDLQHFGPPQRRRRVFVLAARSGGVDPAEVLALSESVCGHPAPRQQSRESTAPRAGTGAERVFDARGNGDGSLTNTLAGDHAIVQADVAFSRGGYGDWSPNESVTSLCARDAKDQSSIVVPSNKEWPKQIADTLTVAYAKKWGLEDQHINGGAGLFHRTLSGRPRRLTPLECERLMGWADGWTEQGVKEGGTVYALSDTARYKLCGNGVGSSVAQWIATQLVTLEGE